MMMKTWLRVLSGVFVVLVATLVAGIAVLTSTDFNQLKGPLSTLVRDATGRALTIDGDLHLAASLNPILTVTGLTFANADWAEATPMMRLQRLEAKIALKPLFSGRLEVDYIVLDGLDLVLQTDGKGKANWEFTSTQSVPKQVSDGALALKPEVRDVRLRNVHVTYRDGASGRKIETDFKRADFRAGGMDSPLIGVIEAVYNTVELEAQAELGSLAQLIGSEGDAFPLDLKISGPGVSADIVGSVDQPGAGMMLKTQVFVEVRDMEAAAKLSGHGLPNWPGMSLRANVEGAGTAFRFKELELNLGGSDFAGQADVDFAGERPHIVAILSSNTLDVNELAGLDLMPSQDVSDPDRVFSDQSLTFDMLRLVEGDLRLTAKQVLLDALAFGDVKAHAKLKDGRLVLRPLSLTYNKAHINTHAMVDSGAKMPKINIRASVRGLDANAFAALAGQDGLVSLKLDGEVNLKGAGRSVRAIMAGLNGSANFIGRNGRIYDERFKGLTEGVGSILPWASHKDANVISCMVAKIPIVNGDARAETMLLDTSGVVVRVSGNADLAGELLHLTVRTDAKKTGLSSFAVPIRIKGPFVKPRIDVDPGDLVVGTVGNIVKAPVKLLAGLLVDTISLVESDEAKKQAAAKNDPCLKALSRGKTQADPPPPVPSSAADKSKSSGDPEKDVENLGKALQKLF